MSYNNAAPRVEDLGTKDLSARQVSEPSMQQPQHLPKVWLFASKGKVGPQYIDFDTTDLITAYGEKTFNPTDKYFNHQTLFAQLFSSNANNCVVHRVIGTNAKDVANLALYLDVLPTPVPLYLKNQDGSLVLDDNGDPTLQKNSNGDPINVPGFKVCWVVEHISKPYGEYQPGLLTQKTGVQVTAENVQSLMYPIFEIAASSPGEDAHLTGIKLYAGFESDQLPFNTNLLNEDKQYQYYFKLIRKVNELTGATSPVYNSFGSEYSKFSIKKNGYDSSLDANIGFEKVIADQYLSLNTNGGSGIGVAKVYTDNLNTVLGNLYGTEKNISDPHRDSVIKNTEDNRYALNIFSFCSSNGSPYQTIKVVDTENSVRLTKNTVVYLNGSSDGLMTDAIFDALVSADLDNYADISHEYQDMVLHPEMIIYDSGFSLDTKKKFTKFISRRKDTIAVSSTYSHINPANTLSDQYSVGVSLKTMYDMFPESATFGTGVMRGTLCAGSGELIDNTLYTKRVPLTYDLADKASKFMGAKNGKWKSGYIFDSSSDGDASVVKTLKNIDVTWVPVPTRGLMWSAGLNFVLNYSTDRQYWPAVQTVYDDDTSVLNSFFVIVAISYLNKISHAGHRKFSGNIKYTPNQLVQKVNEFTAESVKDAFDNLYTIVPNAQITAYDAQKGYRWTNVIKIGANNMSTVMTTYIEAYRLSDLQSS